MVSNNYKYWLMNFIHNVFIHPILPVADIFLHIGIVWLANHIYTLHDRTMPTNQWSKQ